MPVTLLYVEGKLDCEIYAWILGNNLAITRGGSKYALYPQALQSRTAPRAAVMASYLRDRDFDYEPPADLDQPTVDKPASGAGQPPLGWRLNRHSIESYLLDPRVIAAKLGDREANWERWVCLAGKSIAEYQAARWTIGQLRSALPRPYDLQTRDEEQPEFWLPRVLNQNDAAAWCRNKVNQYRTGVEKELEESTVDAVFARRCQQFSEEFCTDPSKILVWYSGKDLFAALARNEEVAKVIPCNNPGDLRQLLRNWVIANPEQFLGLFPELTALRQMLTGAPA